MQDFGKLILRLTLGGLMLFHGFQKVEAFESLTNDPGIGGMLKSQGLPEILAYGVLLGEVLAPALLILGWFTRPAALVFAVNMGVAVWLAHTSDLLNRGPHGAYALELQALYLFGGLAVLCLGPGRLSVDGVGE